MGLLQRVHHTVVGSGEDVVEFGSGSEPVNACGLQEPWAGWGFLFFGEVVVGPEIE